jgi:cytochrome c553
VRRLKRRNWLVPVLAIAVVAWQRSDATPPQGRAATASPAPINLKVLARDISVPELYKVMAGLQKDLGVQCAFCHEEDPDTRQLNYVSDENPRKETARLMMRMTRDINEKYLGQSGDRQYSAPITCGNCHLGQMHPPPYDPMNSR